MITRSGIPTLGMSLVLLGLVTGALTRVVESGFFHGLFQGMTIALMALGAYAIGRGVWGSRGDGDEPQGSMWLPSRDRRE